MTADTGPYRPQVAVGVTRERIRLLTPAAHALHKTILRSFANTGRAPDPAALGDSATGGADLGVLLRELHDRDVVRLDEHGRIRAAYPFSASPTAHTVTIAGGPTAWAMCAIDALGIADMLGRDVTITSTDPGCGEPIRVAVTDGHGIWEPDTAVVLDGANTTAGGTCGPDGDACSAPAVDRCCGVMNFFTSHASADAWLAAHPQVTGVVLTPEQALRLGVDIFGHLLDD